MILKGLRTFKRTVKQAKHKRTALFLALSLICAVLLTPAYAGGNGTTAENNSEIARLQAKANQIAQENKEREQRINKLKGDVAQQDAYIGEVNEQIEQIGAQIDAYIELINAKQKTIDGLVGEIEAKGQEIFETEHNIERREAEIKRLDEENEKNILLYGETIAQMYMSSGGNAVSVLTGSTSFYDILVRTEMIRTIGEKNTELLQNLLSAIERQKVVIDELEQDIAQLKADRLVFEERQKGFETEKAQLEEEREEVLEEINRQYAILQGLLDEKADLQFDVKNLEGQIYQASAEVGDIQTRIAELEAYNREIEAELRNVHESNPDRPSYNSEGFAWPLSSQFKMITCGFGCSPSVPCSWCSYAWRLSSHTGVDIGNSGIGGATVYAMQSGTVTFAGWKGSANTGYGVTVIIDHGGTFSTLYAHMQAGSLMVSDGQFVQQGQAVGSVGTTGHSTGNHLHFEVRVNGVPQNPLNYVSP